MLALFSLAISGLCSTVYIIQMWTNIIEDMPKTFTPQKNLLNFDIWHRNFVQGHSTLFSYEYYVGKHEPVRASKEKIKVLVWTRLAKILTCILK